MLYNLNHYYQMSIESGIASMDCKICACTFAPLTCEVKYWPEVKTYQDYIRKCYSIAQEVPVDDLRREYLEAKFRNKTTLKKLLEKVRTTHQDLNDKNLNYMMEYTPITHVQEQLQQLESEISAEIQDHKPFHSNHKPKADPERKSWFARFFGDC